MTKEERKISLIVSLLDAQIENLHKKNIEEIHTDLQIIREVALNG